MSHYSYERLYHLTKEVNRMIDLKYRKLSYQQQRGGANEVPVPAEPLAPLVEVNTINNVVKLQEDFKIVAERLDSVLSTVDNTTTNSLRQIKTNLITQMDLEEPTDDDIEIAEGDGYVEIEIKKINEVLKKYNEKLITNFIAINEVIRSNLTLSEGEYQTIDDDNLFTNLVRLQANINLFLGGVNAKLIENINLLKDKITNKGIPLGAIRLDTLDTKPVEELIKIEKDLIELLDTSFSNVLVQISELNNKVNTFKEEINDIRSLTKLIEKTTSFKESLK